MVSAVLFLSFFVFLILNVPIAICLDCLPCVQSCIPELLLPLWQPICIPVSVNSFFWQFHFLYCQEILWQKPEFPRD